jgi:hypothetical protein
MRHCTDTGSTQAAWNLTAEQSENDEVTMPTTLVDALHAIRKQRGALFMLDASRWLIESWDLESDRLKEQSEDTKRLVQRLLRT